MAYQLVDGVYDLNISYALIDKDNLALRYITLDTDLDYLKTKALKISFRLNEIILL